MNIYSLPAIISFTVNFSIALIILLNKPKNSLNRWFAAFIFSFSLWNISEIIILNSRNIENALFGAQILYRIIFLSPAFFLIIAYLFPRSFNSFSKKLYFHILIFALPILLLIFSFPNFQIKLITLSQYQQIYYYKITFTNSLPFFLLTLIFMGYSLWGSLILINKIPKLKTSREKNQTRFLLFGISFIFILLIIVNILNAFLSDELSSYYLSTILVIFISIFFLLTISQFKIFKISKLISGGITYSIISSISLAIYFLIIKTLSESLLKYLGLNSLSFEILFILLFIILIRPLESRIRLRVDRLLYRDIHQYRHNFMLFSRELLKYLNSEVFFQKIKEFLTKEFQITSVHIFIKDNNKKLFIAQGNANDIPSLKTDDYLIKRLSSIKHTMELYEMRVELIEINFRQFLINNHIQVLIPLNMEDQLFGIIMLPQRKLKREYPEDIQEILTILGNEVSTAYERNLIFEEIRKEEQKKFRNEHLAALGQLTTGIAHEIRNPLNTISTSAETLLKDNIKHEDEQELKNYIIEEADRLNNILSDFLNLSRLKPPSTSLVQLDYIIDQVILNIESRSHNNFEFKKEIPVEIDEIESDPQLFYQALLNLAINAYDAVEERCIQDKTFDCKNGFINFKVEKKNNNIYISVLDNGIGIDNDNIKKILEPFFTTKESGTGLGLSITYNIIQALGGSLQFFSEKEKTTFTIQLSQ